MTLARRLLVGAYRPYAKLTFTLKGRFGLPVLVPIDGALPIRLLPEGQIARCLHSGSYERVERQLVSRYLRPGMTVIDIGANIGLYALTAERFVGKTGRIWAIEPSQDSYDRLLGNIKLNGAEGITPAKVALSSTDDRFAVLLRENGFLDGERYLLPDGCAAGENAADSERVPTLSLDTFCKRRSIGFIDFIKMDIEGGEFEVLRGANETLAANPGLVMLFEHTREGCARAGTTPQAVAKLLKEYGFHLYAWNQKKKFWDSNHDYILSQGNAWAVADHNKLPRL